MSRPEWIVWGSELSPFTLKVLRLYRQAGQPVRLLPAEGGRWQALRYALRREALVRGLLPLTWPRMTPQDEFPLVPFVFGPTGENLYDSSAVANWLDQGRGDLACFTPPEPAVRMLVRLIDEFWDEWGLYLVHHQRWKVSAADNDAGQRVAREFSALLGPLQQRQARKFAARQTRRLPYLFSVAPAGFHIDGLPPERQPPARPGFPPTHALLERSFLRLLDALEPVFARQRFLFGDRFTLADASTYGALGMNLADPASNGIMAQRAPGLHAWLLRVHGNEAIGTPALPPSIDSALLNPLVAEIRRVFIPLMQQNHAAWRRFSAAGQARWNEQAFNRGEALYDGELDGQPFRHVVKTFQVRVWQQLCEDWQHLPGEARAALGEFGLCDKDFSPG